MILLITACSKEVPLLSTSEASSHIGKEARVQGKVYLCHACGSDPGAKWKLCLDGKPGEEPFAVIVPAELVEKLGPEKIKEWEGKQIEVHGVIGEFKGRPEIELSCLSCLKVNS
ncbi:MAG: hypothetical protein HC904_02185 [Blastochloris sp.]|nr:hypothetical protein [Blastochloris sp.]